MLVLSRKTEQRIRIGDEIEVIVLAIEGDHVKIGIQAPRHITVLRYELVQDVTDENRRAASAAANSATQLSAGSIAEIGSLFRGIGRPGPTPTGQNTTASSPTGAIPSRPAIRGGYGPRPGGGARSGPPQGYRLGPTGPNPRGPRPENRPVPTPPRPDPEKS